MKSKLPIFVLIASIATSVSLVLANLVTTFAVEEPYAAVAEDESLFEFDKTSEETSEEASSTEEESSSEAGGALGSSKKTSISVTENEYNDIPYCLVKADLAYLSDLRTSLAKDSSGNVGVNIKSSFSELIEEAEGTPILAIDGDFPFWSNSRQGYVIRNGVGIRSTSRSDDGDDLAIFKDGSFLVYDEADYSYDEIMAMNGGCYQNWSFGPSLIKNGSISVDEDEEVSGKSMSANQRTAMGITEDGDFYFLCSELDGSRQRGEGLSLYQVASLLQDNGCVAAYNFDGGGSSALYYNLDGKGTYFIDPSRELGDIVYVVAE